MTGAFPVVSLEDVHYYFIAYNYDSNAIIPTAVSVLKDDTIIKILKRYSQNLRRSNIRQRLT